MCLADEDVPQRGRSRGKVEAAREEEALCSGRSLLFDQFSLLRRLVRQWTRILREIEGV